MNEHLYFTEHSRGPRDLTARHQEDGTIELTITENDTLATASIVMDKADLRSFMRIADPENEYRPLPPGMPD